MREAQGEAEPATVRDLRELGDITKHEKVRPLEFLRWAKRHHFPLPEEFAAFLTSRDKKSQAEKPLSTRERHTFLVIIAAALEEAEIDITHPEKAAQTVAKITERMGAPIDHQTIAKRYPKF